MGSEEAVWVHIDRYPDAARQFERTQPVTDDVLHIQRAASVHEQALAVTAAQHGKQSNK